MKKLISTHIFLSILYLFSLMFITISCNTSKEEPKLLSTGEGHLQVPGGKIWYKISGNGTGIPVVLLHGGPGFSSFYLKPLDELGNDRQVIRYDQLGGGKSDRITDTSMFTIEHFVNELDSLRSFLGVDKWHVFGHSWGTILAVEYYKKYPENVVSLTLGSAALDIPAWEKNAKELVTTLSKTSQKSILKAEKEKKYDDPSYSEALNEFYSKYVWINPDAADLDSTMATVNELIYYFMQGPSEFTITGTLKYYNATPFLKKIKVPVLYTVGEFDEANPKTIERFASLTPNSKVVIIKGAAHMTTWDNRDENILVVRNFLNSVDSLLIVE